jgi:hypothetical protein
MKMLMVIVKRQKLALNLLNTRQSLHELRCHLHHSNQHLSQRLSQLQSSRQAFHRQLILWLHLVYHPQHPLQARKLLLSKAPNQLANSVNTADMLSPALKSRPRCPKSRMMLSANKHHPLKVRLKDIQINKHNLNHSHNQVLSLLLLMSFLRTTLRIRNSAMRIIAIIINNMDCSKVHRVKKDRLLSKDRTVATTDLKLRTLLNFPKALRNRANLDIPPQVKVKPAVIPLQTQLYRLNNKEHLKMPNPNQVTNNNHKLATIHTATHTTPAHTMLRT